MYISYLVVRFCLRQHGTQLFFVYGFSALRAEKPYTENGSTAEPLR
jgi:hypothetical protein